MQYERTCSIERAEDGAAAGLISGILATNGEALDGHILNMDGVNLPDRAPLLFGHDDYTGTGNLGSWTGFRKFGEGKKLGKHGIRGTAQIELSGEGSQAAWRSDVAHMIDKGHIGAFSVRWDEIGDPVARVNLPSDHPAFVDSKKANGRQRWGLYFDKWRLLEGSVVTLGADPAALLGRMQASHGDVRGYWRKAINYALTEREEVAGLVGVHLENGETVFVERAAYDAMLEDANSTYFRAMDLHEEATEHLLATVAGFDNPTAPEVKVEVEPDTNTKIRSEVEPGNGDEPTDAATQKPEQTAKADQPEPQNRDPSDISVTTDPAKFLRDFSDALDASEDRIRKAVQDMIDLQTGKVK